MNDITEERVLVVPTELFHRVGHFQGFSSDVDRYFSILTDPANIAYRPRGEMEQDPTFKQLIPYVVFRFNQPNQIQLFHYTRGTGQGEQRLHRLRSIGVGGHISTTDQNAASGMAPYEEGLRRELDEEVIINTPYTQQCVGLINDDESEVGRVHLGVVHLFNVETPQVSARETDLRDAGFSPIEELRTDLPSFETWSQFCLQSLFGGQHE